MIKSIKTDLLFQLLDYTINNHPNEKLEDCFYIMAYADLKKFLESSEDINSIKRFLKHKAKVNIRDRCNS